MTPTPASESTARGGPRPVLAREFTQFLLELAIGVHRYAVYPPGHPSLEPMADAVTELLEELLRDRAVLRIGVGRRELLLEGGSTDPGHPVLGDLAHRLHHRQISGVSFAHGIRPTEVEGLLETLGREMDAEAVPLGLRPVEEIPSWPHVRIHPLGMERLGVADEPGFGGARALDLWMSLAGLVLREEAVDADQASDARIVAARLTEGPADEAVEREVADHLAQLAAELRATSGPETEKVRDKVAVLLEHLDREVLDRIIAMGGDVARRQALLRDVNHSLPMDAVLRVMESAARTGGQTISHSMARLLSKLSVHAPAPGASAGGPDRVAGWSPAGAGLRDIVDHLLEDWDLDDPNPDRYTAVLDSMARAAPLLRERADAEDAAGTALPGAARIVHIALEAGAFGTTVKRAILDLIDRGEAGELVELLRESGEEDPTAARMLDYLTEPEQLHRILAREEVEERALSALVVRSGEDSIEPLMDVLVESESRSLRRKVFDVLAGLGPRVAEKALERLEDRRWFVQRNMLALLNHLEGLPRGFDPLWYTDHGDYRVRREAFPLALRDGASRDRALSLALSDRDERLVRMALLELRDGVPEALVPTLVSRVLEAERTDEIRALGVRTVRYSESVLVRDALMGLAAPGRSLFGRPRLGAPSASVLSALEVLDARWRWDRAALAVLDQARRSRDPAIRRAVGSQER